MEELNLTEIQQAALSVLLDLVEIIDKLELHYSLAWGTLLGAVRHKGFIPWDDDVDIMMPRPDYDRLMSYCLNNKNELIPYEMINIYSNPGYVYVLSRFSDTRYTIDYKNVRDYGLGIFVDIYPVDGLGTTYNEAQYYIKRNAFNRRLAKLVETDYFIKSPNGLIKTMCKFPLYLLAKSIGRSKLIESIDKSCAKVNYDTSKFVGIPTVEIEDKYIIPREWLEDYTTLLFEGHSFSVISRYDSFLTQRYGDYMKLPPENERVAHHYYSAYKK